MYVPSRADMHVHVHVYTHSALPFDLIWSASHRSVVVGVGMWLTVHVHSVQIMYHIVHRMKFVNDRSAH